MTLLARLFFAGGATAVYPSTFADVELDAARYAPGGRGDPIRIRTELDRVIRSARDLTLNSAHPQGGNAMSDDRGYGVVNSRFQVHDRAGLYVCDASVFPTTIGINPQLTIMALADYAWHHAIGPDLGV